MRILLVAPAPDFPDSIPGWIRIPQMSLLILEKLSGNGHHVVTIGRKIRLPSLSR